MATYADMEELIRLGAYRPSAKVDEAIGFFHPQLEAFLGQYKTASMSLIDGYQSLARIVAGNPASAPGTPTDPKA
jgi:flagellum-specific ATP synthase